MNDLEPQTNPREDPPVPLQSSPAYAESCQIPLPPDEELGLRRGIRPWMANLITIGGIIGLAYFIGSGYLVSQLGPSVILIYALGGLIIWTVMQSFAELLVNVPRQGNFISYSAEFLSPTWAVGTAAGVTGSTGAHTSPRRRSLAGLLCMYLPPPFPWSSGRSRSSS